MNLPFKLLPPSNRDPDTQRSVNHVPTQFAI